MANEKQQTKAQTGPTAPEQSKPGQPEPDVEAGDARELAQIDVKERFVQKVGSGNFTFNEDEIRALAAELGVEEEVEATGAFRTFEGGPANPLAGLTPATGSGGTPISADAATDETKEYASELKSKEESGDLNEVDSARARTLARATDA